MDDVSKLREIENLEKQRKTRERNENQSTNRERSRFPPFLLRSTENWRAGGYAAWCVCVFCQIGIDTPDKRWTALTTKPPVSIQIPCSRKRPDATCSPDPRPRTRNPVRIYIASRKKTSRKGASSHHAGKKQHQAAIAAAATANSSNEA